MHDYESREVVAVGRCNGGCCRTITLSAEPEHIATMAAHDRRWLEGAKERALKKPCTEAEEKDCREDVSDSPIDGWRKQAREDAAKALMDLAVELDHDGHPAMAAIYREQAVALNPALAVPTIPPTKRSLYRVKLTWDVLVLATNEADARFEATLTATRTEVPSYDVTSAPAKVDELPPGWDPQCGVYRPNEDGKHMDDMTVQEAWDAGYAGDKR